jgi:hypothetical protein
MRSSLWPTSEATRSTLASCRRSRSCPGGRSRSWPYRYSPARAAPITSPGGRFSTSSPCRGSARKTFGVRKHGRGDPLHQRLRPQAVEEACRKIQADQAAADACCQVALVQSTRAKQQQLLSQPPAEELRQFQVLEQGCRAVSALAG